jgi:hypothetical protein
MGNAPDEPVGSPTLPAQKFKSLKVFPEIRSAGKKQNTYSISPY